MTPQERQLVQELFERLATLEREPRDADAERAIREGLARAPNAIYALVQTTLVQDEALRRANARIEELEAAMNDAPPERGGFLDNLRETMFGSEPRRGGSVPTVRADERGRADERWSEGRPDDRWGSSRSDDRWSSRSDDRAGSSRPMGVPPGYGREQDYGGRGGPPSGAYGNEPLPGGAFGRGGSFLGTAAAAAAGVIGGSLLLGGIRNALGTAHAGQGAVDAAGAQSPWSGGAADSDLSRQAGADDIGARRASAYDEGGRDAGRGHDANEETRFDDASQHDAADYDDDMDVDFDGDTDTA